MATQASLARLQNRVGAYTLVATNDDLANAVLKDQSGEDLSKLEALKVEYFYSTTLSKWEWEYQQYLSGIDANFVAEDCGAVFRDYPRMRRLWADEAFKCRFAPKFVQFMNEKIAVP